MISIKSLNKFFNKGKQNEIHVINNISLDLPERGMVALFGKSGCGKTTLLNAIGGLDKTESGSILIGGENIKSHTDIIRNQYIGYIFQNYNLNKNESNFDNVADALRLCGMTDKAEIEERVMAALANVGMDKYKARTPDTLSGGQMQRIAIARAIVKNPKIILADEPTGNLDEANTILIMDLLKKIAEDHLVILVTHEAKLVDYYCDKVIELSDGKIISSRENTPVGGYTERSKTDIYLGELDKNEASAGGVNLEYYGETPALPVKLRIVNHGGKIYLSVDSERVQILDATSEIKLREGVYTEMEKAAENKANIDMSRLPPFTGSHFGRLFNFKGSFKSGYKANFKKNKKSTKALRACMFLFSLVLVVMAANLGTAFKSIGDIQEQYNPKMFYVFTPNTEISNKINAAVGTNGIENIQMQTGRPYGNGMLYISPGRFESFKSTGANFGAYTDLLDIKFAGTPSLITGKADKLADNEIVITSTLADRLLDAATVGFVNSYDSLLGLYANYESNNVSGKLRIVGIIRSDECCAYRSSVASAKSVLYNMGIYVMPNLNDELKLNSGEAFVVIRHDNKETELPSKGEEILINGQKFTVKDILTPYGNYDEYLMDIGSDLYEIREGETDPVRLWHYEYLRKLFIEENPTLTPGSPEFETALSEYTDINYYKYLEKLYEPFDSYMMHNYTVIPSNYVAWLYFDKGITEIKSCMIGDMEYHFIQQYKEKTGTYPSQTYINEHREDVDNAWNNINNTYQKYQDQYNQEFYATENSRKYENECVINEADYVKLANYVGETHESVLGNKFNNGYIIQGDGKDEVTMVYLDKLLYTTIYSSDSEATKSFISQFESTEVPVEFIDAVYTPDSIFENLMENFKEEIILKLIILAVFLVVMSLCMYFIMRSSLMSRIKEVGIYRAIGVSKKNLTFRFLIEAFVLTTFTVFIGYLISSGFLFGLSASVALLETLLYYPLWLAGTILILLYTVCLICGILPIRSLLRKTPSEILSKYDI